MQQIFNFLTYKDEMTPLRDAGCFKVCFFVKNWTKEVRINSFDKITIAFGIPRRDLLKYGAILGSIMEPYGLIWILMVPSGGIYFWLPTLPSGE